MNRIIVSALPVIGIILSFILISHLEFSPRPVSGTFICTDTENVLLELMTLPGMPHPAEEQGADDDDDSARESSKLTNSSVPAPPPGNHFFDHPSFDETFIQVATPPPKA